MGIYNSACQYRDSVCTYINNATKGPFLSPDIRSRVVTGLNVVTAVSLIGTILASTKTLLSAVPLFSKTVVGFVATKICKVEDKEILAEFEFTVTEIMAFKINFYAFGIAATVFGASCCFAMYLTPDESNKKK